MDHFGRLPEGCISQILSFTSPLDASKSSTVSKLFKSAAESDHLWSRFLPKDCQQLLSTSVMLSPAKYATKKDLYFALCNNPILVHGGKMSFSLDKRNGKKCFMVGARQLLISWKGCWDFISHAKSRFSEVAKLRSIGWIHIQGKIKAEMLSENSIYAAYLVFWLERMDGLKSSNTIVRVVNDESRNSRSNEEEHLISWSPPETGKIARKRVDGWMELEMGEFHINGYGGDNCGEVEAWLIEINSPHHKSGLIVEGIEFRPI